MMNRRNALTTLLGIAGTSTLAGGIAHAEDARISIPEAIPLKLGKTLQIDLKSTPIKLGERDLHLITIGSATFQLDEGSRRAACRSGESGTDKRCGCQHYYRVK